MKYVSIDIRFWAKDDFDHEAFTKSLHEDLEKAHEDVETAVAAVDWGDDVVDDVVDDD